MKTFLLDEVAEEVDYSFDLIVVELWLTNHVTLLAVLKIYFNEVLQLSLAQFVIDHNRSL